VTELYVAVTGTNSRPIVIGGTEALVGKPVDDAVLAALGKLIQKQVSPMRTTTMPAHYRRRVAAALACRLLKTLWEER
jgi:4-hydroxybenzoyl-CoA reductase subunit beta